MKTSQEIHDMIQTFDMAGHPELVTSRILDIRLSPQELDALMPSGEYVHTFIQSGPILLGADWNRAEILKAAERGAELSGDQATAMKHGAVVWNENKEPVFIETVPNARTEP